MLSTQGKTTCPKQVHKQGIRKHKFFKRGFANNGEFATHGQIENANHLQQKKLFVKTKHCETEGVKGEQRHVFFETEGREHEFMHHGEFKTQSNI